MCKILVKEDLAQRVHAFTFQAPHVAQKAREGQFVILRVDETGERIPLVITDYDRDEGTITIVIMQMGKTTRKLATLKPDESVADIAGPLGQPTPIENYGTVVLIGGGFAVAAVVPIARAMKEAGNKVISIMGAKGKFLLFGEERLRRVSDELAVTTDDGSYARKGLVTDQLQDLIDRGEKIDLVIAIGPTPMMRACSNLTKPYGIKTLVNLNPIMLDGMGMCGSCRCSVGGETKFACVDGPDFDGHEVDWDLLVARQRMYVDQERQSLEMWVAEHAADASDLDMEE